MSLKSITYPLTFKSEQEHIQHVKDNRDFYNKILNPVNKDIEEELKQEKQEKETLGKALQKTKEDHYREIREKDTAITIQNKEIESIKTEKESLQEKIKENAHTVSQANQLVKKEKQYKEVEPTSKGKTFEEEIKYALKCENRKRNDARYQIDDTNITRACDIRIYGNGLSIGIEAKAKKRIEKGDIDKFNSDRVKNNFTGSVFWSKTSKILGTDDSGEGEGYLSLDVNNCLMVRGDDFHRIVQIIFTYANFLTVLKDKKGDDSQARDVVKKVFDMMLNRYTALGKLKKEVQRLDITLVSDLETVSLLCRENNIDHNPFKKAKGHLHVVKEKSNQRWFDEHKKLNVNKQPTQNFWESVNRNPSPKKKYIEINDDDDDAPPPKSKKHSSNLFFLIDSPPKEEDQTPSLRANQISNSSSREPLPPIMFSKEDKDDGSESYCM